MADPSPQNPHAALGLYRRAGFEVVAASAAYRRPFDAA
jgi:ribosomal protein S18 acetylase RimI-like enzyme